MRRRRARSALKPGPISGMTSGLCQQAGTHRLKKQPLLEHTFRQRMQSPIPKPQNMVFPNTTPIPKYFISSVFLGAAGRWPTSVLGLGSGFCEVLPVVSGWYRGRFTPAFHLCRRSI